MYENRRFASEMMEGLDACYHPTQAFIGWRRRKICLFSGVTQRITRDACAVYVQDGYVNLQYEYVQRHYVQLRDGDATPRMGRTRDAMRPRSDE